MANVHKPIMVREFPPGSGRKESLWPMFWASKEGSCPFVRPTRSKSANAKATTTVATTATATATAATSTTPAVAIPMTQKHYARPNIPKFGENKQIVNRGIIPEQPASGIINSSTAIRSTTTCGGSNITSTTLSGIHNNGGGILPSRQVLGLKSRLTTTSVVDNQMNPPPPTKKRKTETTLREQLAKSTSNKKGAKREGYCENCKKMYDNYEDVLIPYSPKKK